MSLVPCVRGSRSYPCLTPYRGRCASCFRSPSWARGDWRDYGIAIVFSSLNAGTGQALLDSLDTTRMWWVRSPVVTLLLDHPDQVRNLLHHAMDRRGIFALDDLVETLVKPSPLMVSFCFSGAQIIERKYCSLIIAYEVCHDVTLLRRLWQPNYRGPIAILILELVDGLSRREPARNGFRAGRSLVASWMKRIEGGLDNVVRVRRAKRLGKHVLNRRRRSSRREPSCRRSRQFLLAPA